MPAESFSSPAFDSTVLSHLACPACYKRLRMEPARLVCDACGRAYPIVDGIPVLIVARAVLNSRPE
ncbi:MAG: Trm112 family protein [Terracidiphilus sp.]